MFDRILFDKYQFDKYYSDSDLTINIGTMFATSDLKLSMIFKTPVEPIEFRGRGFLDPGVGGQFAVRSSFIGVGSFINSEIILVNEVPINLTAEGNLVPGLSVHTPLDVALEGYGLLNIDDNIRMNQQVLTAMNGVGTVNFGIVFKTDTTFNFYGDSELSGQILPRLPLSVAFNGISTMRLRRIGSLNENALELEGLEFLPGDTITIDTDTLQVLFGSVEDVSNVTSDSVFFEVNPGENELIIETDTNSLLDVIVIWQNRWL